MTESESEKMYIILEHLCQNPEISFKSQQLDEPDLSFDDKVSLAKDILSKSYETFLCRFGKYFELKHLEYFEDAIGNAKYDCNTKTLINDMRMGLLYKQNSRRYNKYIKRHIAVNKDKSGIETEEARELDMVDVLKSTNSIFSNIIARYIDDAEQTKSTQHDHENLWSNVDQVSTDSLINGAEESIPKCRNLWGEFDNDESMSDESQFAELPDYHISTQSCVDDKNDVDFSQLNQDEEDKYFDSISDNDECEYRDPPQENMNNSEDELDIYMHELKQNN